MRSPKILLSPKAEQDIIEIGGHIALDNAHRAQSFIGELQDFLAMLAENPMIGRTRPEHARGLRSIPFVGYKYSIYYRVIRGRTGITIERILHGARDVGRLF